MPDAGTEYGQSDFDLVRICRNPVFVIGAERSGTTILALSLGQHGELWYSCEGHFFQGLFEPERLDRVYSRGMHRYRWIQEERVTKEELLESLGIGINALYTGRSQGKRWIEKTPKNTLMVDVLADMFPGAAFIHIVRDGRSVVHSMINFLTDIDDQIRSDRVMGGVAPRWATDFAVACEEWQRYVMVAAEFAAEHPSRCLTVKYEELVAKPEEGFRRIFQFIEVPDDEGSARFFGSNRINSSFHRAVEPASQDSRPDPWEEWTPEQRSIFLQQAGEAMVLCGLMTGEEMRRALDEVGGEVTLS